MDAMCRSCCPSSDDDVYYRGSLTVEAALLMSVILMILFLVIQMTLFLTDTTRMTAFVIEDASYTVDEEESRREWRAAVKGDFFYLRESLLNRSADEKNVRVEYPATDVSLGYGVNPEFQVDQEYPVRDPVKYMWWIRMIRDSRE